jgi:hypothetical protein
VGDGQGPTLNFESVYCLLSVVNFLPPGCQFRSLLYRQPGSHWSTVTSCSSPRRPTTAPRSDGKPSNRHIIWIALVLHWSFLGRLKSEMGKAAGIDGIITEHLQYGLPIDS